MKLPGWKHVGGAVYDHCSGVRVHSMGLCQLPDGLLVNGRSYPEIQTVDRFVRINGGNRRRGVMAWAIDVLKEWEANP